MSVLDISKGYWGTHTSPGSKQPARRPYGGWPNTCAPEVRAGRPIRRARKRLAERQADWDTLMKRRGVTGFHKPGSLQP